MKKEVENAKADQIYRLVIVFGLIMMGVWFCFGLCDNGKPKVSTPQQEELLRRDIAQNWDKIELAVMGFVEAGLIVNMEWFYSEVYVSPLDWHVMTFSAKKDFTFLMFKYCAGMQNDYSGSWVDILDGYSGKKLAKYDSSGFKIY